MNVHIFHNGTVSLQCVFFCVCLNDIRFCVIWYEAIAVALVVRGCIKIGVSEKLGEGRAGAGYEGKLHVFSAIGIF